MTKFIEKQYSIIEEYHDKFGLVTLGPMSSFTWNNDPKRLLFVLARYKFVSKMLCNSKNVLEIGCGDGFASRIVKQQVETLTLTDFDASLLSYANTYSNNETFNVKTFQSNITDKSHNNTLYDGIYALDVLEHIDKSNEDNFIQNIVKYSSVNAKIIIGMPSIESQIYASPASIVGHINCKTSEELNSIFSKYFINVFNFSMNDEIVHTGFNRMANYIFVVCSGVKLINND